jgi:hypothetical protein
VLSLHRHSSDCSCSCTLLMHHRQPRFSRAQATFWIGGCFLPFLFLGVFYKRDSITTIAFLQVFFRLAKCIPSSFRSRTFCSSSFNSFFDILILGFANYIESPVFTDQLHALEVTLQVRCSDSQRLLSVEHRIEVT